MQHFISRRTSKLYASRNDVIVIRNTSDWSELLGHGAGEELRGGAPVAVGRRIPIAVAIARRGEHASDAAAADLGRGTARSAAGPRLRVNEMPLARMSR